MDIEKLIERLYKHHTDWGEGRTQDFFEVCLDCKEAATALSTLQAENEKLRAELEQVISERDAAVERIREWEKFDTYLFVHNFIMPEKWRGPGKEN